MRDTVIAPGLSGEASGCGGVVDTTGGARGARTRDPALSLPVDPIGNSSRNAGIKC